MKTKSLLLLAVVSLATAWDSSSAADKTWDGGAGNGTWTVANNWDSNVAPSALDSLFFAGATQTATTNDFSALTQFNGLTFNAGANSFTLAGNAINLGGNITNSSLNDQTINLALALQQNVVIDTGAVGTTTTGGLTLGGTISGAYGLVKNGTGRLVLGGNNSFTGGLQINSGTVQNTGANTLVGTGPITLGSTSGGDVLFSYGSSYATPSNAFIVAAGSGTRTLRLVQDGNVTLSGSITLNNDLIVDSGVAGKSRGFTLGGTISGNNKITFTNTSGNSTATASITGATSRISFTGTIQVNSGANFASGLGMDLVSATVNVKSGGTFDFKQAGTIAGLDGEAGGIVTESNSAKQIILGGAGTYNFGGTFQDTLTNSAGVIVRLNNGGGSGTQTFSGTSTFTGPTSIQAGKLVLDYSTNDTSKLSNTGVLTLRSGTLELSGGTHTEAVGSTTTAGGGQVNIIQTGGTSKLAMGAITNGGGINFSASNIATTTTATTNNLLGNVARYTIAGADWAINDGSGNIVAFTSYSGFVQTGGTNTLNYLLTGGNSLTGNATFGTLKINSATGSAQTLALGTRTLALGSATSNGGILFTGSDNYSITTTTGGLSGNGGVIIQNYGSGTLSLGAVTSSIEHFGTGKTILTTATTATTATYNSALTLNKGTVQFSNNNQFASYLTATAGVGSLSLNSGTLLADTSGGDISLTYNTGASNRAISLGTDNPAIDVIGGGSLTIGGVLSSSSSYVTPVTFGSALSNGKIVLSGTNTYTGDTILAGGTLSVNSSTSLGASTSYQVIVSGNSTLQTTADITSTWLYNVKSGVTGTISTNSGTTLTQNGTIVGAGQIVKAGTGTLTFGAANTYTGNTTVTTGTLLVNTAVSSTNSGTGTGGVAVSGANTVLGGSGQITPGGTNAITIGSGSILAPGDNGIGTLVVNGINSSATGLLTLSSGAKLAFALNGTNTTSGTLQLLSGASGDIAFTSNVITFSLVGSLTSGQKFTLFDGTDNNQFTGLTVDGSNKITSGLSFTGLTGGFENSYLTLTNGDLVLNAVPEPTTWALLAFSLTTVVVLRRRR